MSEIGPGNPARTAHSSLTTGQRFGVDLLSGSTNALATLAIVLTLGMLAFAPLGPQAAGVGIAASFACVVVGGLVYARLGSSAAATGAPSSATALILAGLVAQVVHDPAVDLSSASGVVALMTVTGATVALMGALQIGMAWLGLGRLANFVPQPVLAGFMNAVALLILLAQLPVLLGLPPQTALSDGAALAGAQPLTLAVGLLTAGTAWLLAWRWPRLPATTIAMGVGSAAFAALTLGWPAAALGPQVGPVAPGALLPNALLPLVQDDVRALLLRHAPAMLLTAAVLAVIGSLESLLGALATDQMTRNRHDPRRELLALGAANIAAGICGGLPMVLSRARAVLMIRGSHHGRRAIAVASLVLAGAYLVGGPLLALLPKTVLAGIMVTVAVALIDAWTRQLLRQLRAGERSVEVGTSLVLVAAVGAVTLGLGFVPGITTGVLLAMLVFIRNMNRSLLRGRCSAAERPSRRIWAPAQEALLARMRQRITVLDLEGALFFGNAERLRSQASSLPADSRCLVLDLQRVGTIDESGAIVLQQLSWLLGQRGVTLLLAGVSADNARGRQLRAFGCFRDPQRPDWWPDGDRAIEAAERQLLADTGVADPQATMALADTLLLRGLDPQQCDRVLARMPAQLLAAGAALFREGDPGDRLYVLTQGSISIVGGASVPRQRFVSFSPGLMFGETAMLDGRGRSADAIADCDSSVHSLSLADMDRLRADDPALGEQLVRNIAIHLAERLRAAASAWRASAA
ncbi:MAG: SulP family inorganic anion transporter [Rubrivivax sp.]|nr:SulP family inorganic anion transporter [Rubrivivax sp.]